MKVWRKGIRDKVSVSELLDLEDCKKIFEFNTRPVVFTDYSQSTVLKTSLQTVQNLYTSNVYTENIAQLFLNNYLSNNNYLGFKYSLSEYFSEEAELATSSYASIEEFEKDTIKLPSPKNIKATLSKCIELRRSCRQFSDSRMSQQTLANILYHSCGVSRCFEDEQTKQKLTLRNCGSAGGLYPVYLIIYCHNVQSLEDGFYKYFPHSHALFPMMKVKDESVRDFAEFGYINAEDSNLIILYIYDYLKNTKKYGTQGTAYAFIEAGEIAQNIHLAATGLLYGSVDIGGYNKEYLEKHLNLNVNLEHVIHMTVVGRSVDS